jgi:hypothetical protein
MNIKNKISFNLSDPDRKISKLVMNTAQKMEQKLLSETRPSKSVYKEHKIEPQPLNKLNYLQPSFQNKINVIAMYPFYIGV